MQNFQEIVESYLSENLERYLLILRKMVEVNSFTANANGVNELGRYTADLFEAKGFKKEAIQSDYPTFGEHIFLSRHTGEKSKQTKTIGLISHLDTVFPPEEERVNIFYWRKEGSRIYGPGTVDIKGGTVLIYMIVEALEKFYPEVYDKHDWVICLDASEERLSMDFGELCKQRIPAERGMALVFEGGNIVDSDFLLVTARKGKASFRVSVEGRSAHAGNNHAGGANAIVQLAHTIQKIASLTDYERDITFNVGKVAGGVVMNRVPHLSEAEVEMRAFSPDIFENGIQSILALNGDSQVSSKDGFSCRVSVMLMDRTEPWPENEYTNRLFEYWSETAEENGIRVRKENRGGLSDGNLLWSYCPTLDGLGPAGNNSHCSERDLTTGKDQEFVFVNSFVPKALLNTLAIVRMLL